MQLKWETSSNGLNALHLERGRIHSPNPIGIAQQKVGDISRIRAAFGGEWTGFEPYVRLWIKGGKDATGLTVLMHNYPRNGDPNPLPDVCVRWAEWHAQLALQGYATADDKQQYIRDDLPLRCVLRFYRSGEIGIDPLMERTSRLLAGGVSFAKVDRDEVDRREVTIEFCDGLLFYQFSFSPGSFSSVPLETVVQEWVDYARSLPSDCPPDEDFQIAYRESLWERMARYDQPR
jgi:hypothetical protein